MADGDNRENGGQTDETDTKSLKSWMTNLLPEKPEKKPIVPILPVEKDADDYNMEHKFRGKALIFNHKIFRVDNLSPRSGTDQDRDSLAETLRLLDFQVEIYNDLTYSKLRQVIDNVSVEDHTNADCLIIAVFSHGVPNKIYAFDECYNRDELWDPFTPDNCKSLAGKPKIFLIQACQGDKLDGGIQIASRMAMTVVDSAPSRHEYEFYKIPNRADFFMACSTYPGYYSWRNTTKGSWFIESLCQVFKKELNDGCSKTFMSLMTAVARKVALYYESFVPNTCMDQQKQVVFITSTLIREIYFRPKSDTCIGSIKTSSPLFQTTTTVPVRLRKMSPRRTQSQRDSSGYEPSPSFESVLDSSLARPIENHPPDSP